MRVLWLAALAAAWTANSAFAQTAGVFPVTGTNLSEGESAAIGALIATAYATETGGRVLSPAQTGPAFTQAGSHRDAAALLGLHEYVTVDAIRMQLKIAVHARLHNVHGSTLYDVTMTALSLDDMEQVAERIAMSLRRRTPLEYTREMDNITGKESKAPNRLFIEKVFGIRTGFVLAVAADIETVPSLLVQFDGRLENPTYFLEFGLGVMVPGDRDRELSVLGLVGQIGASYYLTDGNIAPYVGAGFAPRLMVGNIEGAGLTGNAQFGVMFMRMASSRLYVELRVDQHLLPLEWDGDHGRYDEITGQYVYDDRETIWPTEFSIAAGIGW